MAKPNIHNKRHEAHSVIVRRQAKLIQNIAIGVIVLVVGLVLFGVLSNTVFLSFRDVATVNGEGIKATEFIKRAKLERIQQLNQLTNYMQIAQMFGTDPMTDPTFAPIINQSINLLSDTNSLGSRVLDIMIGERLIKQEAVKRGITVTAEEIELRIQQEYGYFPNGTPTAAPTLPVPAEPTLGPTQLALVTITPTFSPPTSEPTATLEPGVTPEATATVEPTATATVGPTATALPTATPFSKEAYENSLQTTLDGLSEQAEISVEDYRQIYEYIIFREKLREQVTADLQPVEEQVWAQHILVATEEEALGVLARLEAGEDWSDVALEVSLDSGSAINGGSLGWFGKGMMVAPFEEAAFALQTPGELSQPVPTSFGYHIIRLVDRGSRPLTDQQFEDLKTRVFNEFLIALRDDSDISTYDTFWQGIVPTEPALQ